MTKNRKVFDFGRAFGGTKAFSLLCDNVRPGPRTDVNLGAGTPKPFKPPLDVDTAVLNALKAWEAWLSTGPGSIHLNTVIGPGKTMADAMEDLKTAAVEIIRKDMEDQ